MSTCARARASPHDHDNGLVRAFLQVIEGASSTAHHDRQITAKSDGRVPQVQVRNLLLHSTVIHMRTHMVYFEGPSTFNSHLEGELRRLCTRAAQATDESCTSMAKSATESVDVRFCVREDSPTLFFLLSRLYCTENLH